jgi:hypothetical protein
MAIVNREYKICDRCQFEIQVYEIDDEGTSSDWEWLSVATNPDRKGYHLCPECAADFRKFIHTMPDPELRAHLAEAQKEVDK